MGFEPLEQKQEGADNKELKENADSIFSVCWDKIVQKHHELKHIINS